MRTLLAGGALALLALVPGCDDAPMIAPELAPVSCLADELCPHLDSIDGSTWTVGIRMQGYDGPAGAAFNTWGLDLSYGSALTFVRAEKVGTISQGLGYSDRGGFVILGGYTPANTVLDCADVSTLAFVTFTVGAAGDSSATITRVGYDLAGFETGCGL